MLTLNNLTYLYQHLPMRFSFAAQAGERLAILGPSGAGKSTLLSLIGGFLPINQGSLVMDGVDHTNSVPSARPVSMLFQENNLFPHLTVQQNMALGLHPGLKLTRAQQQQVTDIAEQTGLQELLTRLPGQLSGGQRQRVALARCLLRNQPILLLDEPFSALDPALRGEMLQLVRSVCETRNITLLMVSHSLEDAQQIAPRSLVIVDGRIYWDGSTESLIRGESTAAAILGVQPR
ncbi:thiamine ABC transporter ATP-binding protein [Pantoea sp. RIT-PI-b]|uniref:thiamine ABC transporter ATP-binding protein ThiQ n=1 Tax=Pantoea sp. RIT-PI-b TaxID=1681195 RepID=UPI000675EAEC|nr:thiamine ABC transporter ATP-binding protein ThiQ [Pantoea sp. RIT-PI-b]KNC14179.1 thiamine ABC transporter ATP-binding protein [Pantoea sp. RIT-PI-b]